MKTIFAAAALSMTAWASSAAAATVVYTFDEENEAIVDIDPGYNLALAENNPLQLDINILEGNVSGSLRVRTFYDPNPDGIGGIGVAVVNKLPSQSIEFSLSKWGDDGDFDFEEVVVNGTTTGQLAAAFDTFFTGPARDNDGFFLTWTNAEGPIGINVALSAVPVPASALLLLAGLGGLGAMKRRKKA